MESGNSLNTDKPYLFQEGKSGNPNGRPKIPSEVKEAFRAFTIEARDTLVSVMRDDEARPSERTKAAEIILNRAWGSPETSVAVSGQISTKEIDTSKLSDDQRDSLISLAGIIAAPDENDDQS